MANEKEEEEEEKRRLESFVLKHQLMQNKSVFYKSIYGLFEAFVDIKQD